eukprot:TRINITY_DN441_c0_g1_i2.p2 TRINITY_DN441_c0_g1~~TRINITY_DN441_c0_g1_i2.p2  ORF type:complete len:104 (-),score=1.67 TRINITY_DN441_c0_g1_i2:77-388(-)
MCVCCWCVVLMRASPRAATGMCAPRAACVRMCCYVLTSCRPAPSIRKVLLAASDMVHGRLRQEIDALSAEFLAYKITQPQLEAKLKGLIGTSRLVEAYRSASR